MTFYFSAALTQKKQFGKYYQCIVQYLESQGHRVLQDTTKTTFKQAVEKTDYERFSYYQQVITWIKKADAVILEVSFPSTLHIGHEVSLAIDQGKPVVALYQFSAEPSFFLGLDHQLVHWQAYREKTIIQSLQRGLRFVQDYAYIRYNFSMSVQQYRYLDVCAQSRRMSKAAFIRSLIDTHIRMQQKTAI